MFRGFFSGQKLTAEQQVVKKASDEADPTKYSGLPPKGKLHSEGRVYGKKNKLVYDKDSRYVEILRRPEQQQATARMVKGIINVSDIVAVDDKNLSKNRHYYSREIPVERIENPTPMSEILADIFVLDFVFGNSDRFYSEDGGGNNLKVDRGRAAYFDFESGAIGAGQQVDTWVQKLRRLDSAGMNIAKEKLGALRGRFEGEEGLNFLNAVVQSSGRTAWNLFAPQDRGYAVADLQKNLLLRINSAFEKIIVRQREETTAERATTEETALAATQERLGMTTSKPKKASGAASISGVVATVDLPR